MNLRTIIVDDEPLAVKRLQIALRQVDGIELLGTASDGAKALELINSCSPDLVLLDIKMPVMNGLDLVQAIGSASVPEIIFVTAYDTFAVSAFEAGAVGYVLKPIGEDQLRTAVERARVKLKTRNAQERLEAMSALMAKLQLAEPPPESSVEQELWINSGTTMERVAVRDVDWFEAAGDYVAIHSGQREHLLHDSLRSLADRLDRHEFARVHRKAIVRVAAIDAVERGKFGAMVLIMASGHRVPVSRTYRQILQARIGAGGRAGQRAGANESFGDGDELISE